MRTHSPAPLSHQLPRKHCLYVCAGECAWGWQVPTPADQLEHVMQPHTHTHTTSHIQSTNHITHTNQPTWANRGTAAAAVQPNSTNAMPVTSGVAAQQLVLQGARQPHPCRHSKAPVGPAAASASTHCKRRSPAVQAGALQGVSTAGTPSEAAGGSAASFCRGLTRGGAPAGGQGQRPAGVQGSLMLPARGDAGGGRGGRPTLGEVHTDRRERLSGDPTPGEGSGPGLPQGTGCTSSGLGAAFCRAASVLWAPSMGWGRPGCTASPVGGLGIIRSDPAALAGA
jgi:hypothetical protein